MAKKKKPSGNPARGFATTSIPSKPKADQPVADVTNPGAADTPSKGDIATLKNEYLPLATTQASKPDIEPSPEELEAQLERDELQLLVEKYAPKVRREINRHVSRLQADRRVLRGQSLAMTVHDWLPEEIMSSTLSLAQAESNDSNRRQGQQSLLKLLNEEDLVLKLWTLDLILRDLGFSDAHVQPVLRWLCADAASIDTATSVWGLQEALEWLALDQSGDTAFSYDESKLKHSAASTPAMSRPITPVPKDSADESNNSKLSKLNEDTTQNRSPGIKVSSNVTSTGSEPSDVSISDLDSDLEPEDVVPTYLKIKGKLFEIDPQLSDSLSRKPNKKSRQTPKEQPPTVRKLISQLQQIESDALFDAREAEDLWPSVRNKIAQERAVRRQQDAARPNSAQDSQGEQLALSPKPDPNELESSANTANASVSDEEGDILGEMFSVAPDQKEAQEMVKDANDGDILLRDFGKGSGMSPRRVLEEAVRLRDPNARLTFKMISPTVYSCRHSITISWSKNQEIEYDHDIAGVLCSVQGLKATFEASTVATTSVEQSESYISTATLFSISASVPKEEKTYLRLPSNWKELYREFLEHRKSRIDAIDREAVKHYRSLIQDQVDNEESDGVVLTSRFKMRNQAISSSNSSNPSPKPHNQPIDGLRQLWAQKSATSSYNDMLTVRKTLPVYAYRETILSSIDKSQLTIICGETGCGKSTQIPSFILEHELLQGKGCKIMCTEPRRISATSLAQRVSEELGESARDLGTFRSLVGYAIRLESKTCTQTRLIYATVGVVLRMLESSGDLEDITHLIIDEVHERSIDTDFMLIILRSLMLRRPGLKVILMSATVDADRFSRYFNDSPILTVPGRTFPVQTRYLEDAIELTHYNVTNEMSKVSQISDDDEAGDGAVNKTGIPTKLPGYSVATRNALSGYDEYAIDYDLIICLIELISSQPEFSRFSAAILVFLPGIAEIRQLNDLFVGHPSFDHNWFIYPLHSTISSEDQQAAFLIPPPGVRKIVLATNIAETGVTIPDITCVIDTGKHKEMRFDERRQLSRLTQSFISRANAKQRRGRAGRVQEGLAFHLFTKYRHDNLMNDQQTPEMLRLSLQDLVVRTKICKLGDIESTLSQALDPPSSKNIRRSIDALIEVDALTPGEELTPLGRQIAKLPLDAHLGKLVLLACTFACVDVAVSIAAILSSKSPFVTPFGARQRADAARLAFKKGDSDLLTSYNAYKSWKAVCNSSGKSEQQFCHKNFLSPRNLSNIEDLKAQLLSSLVEAGFVKMTSDEHRALNRYRSTSRHRIFVQVPDRYDTQSNNDVLVNAVITAAFYPKILVRDCKGWRNISNNQSVSLAPTSVNRGSPVPQFLSYYHIMQSNNKFYNAHSTSLTHPLPTVLMAGADVDFKLHAGVISLPGNAVRFTVREWRAAVALKVLRRRIKEILAATWKNPGRQLSDREKEWWDLLFRVFEERLEKEEKVRERSAGKAK